MKSAPTTLLTSEQRKYLLARLNSTSSWKVEERAMLPMPASIKAAEKKVKEWNARMNKFRDRAHAEVNKDRARVKQEILFATPHAALKAVQEFERKYR